jgi:hypothetical protein
LTRPPGRGSGPGADLLVRQMARRRRLTFPWALVAISFLVSVVAVSGLVYVLFKRSVGPGEALHAFYTMLSAGDCEGSYRYLSEGIRGEMGQQEWCSYVEAQEGGYPRQFAIVRYQYEASTQTTSMVVLEEGTGARPGSLTWWLTRNGNTWRVSGFPTERTPAAVSG